MTPTTCASCGRVLSPQLIPGRWTCQTCRTEEPVTDTPASHGGGAPPPQVRTPAEAEALAAEPPDQETPNRAADAIVVDEGDTMPDPPTYAPQPLAPPRMPVAVEAAPPVPIERPEPSWRELGWWLSLSESGQETLQAKGGAAALRLYYVSRLGLPLWAAAELSLIGGRLVVSAKLLRAIAAQRGYRVVPETSTDETCTAALVQVRTGDVLGRYTFTMRDAHQAGLIRARSAWTTHPKRMLWARASKFVLDDFAPDVALGIVTTDEYAEIRASQAEPIGVDMGYDHATPDDLRERDEDIPF